MDSFLKLIIFIEIFIGMGVWIYWYIKNKSKKDYAIAPITFMLHGLLFSAAAGLNLLSRDVFIIWRDLISIHGLIIIITTGIVLIQLTGGKNGNRR